MAPEANPPGDLEKSGIVNCGGGGFLGYGSAIMLSPLSYGRHLTYLTVLTWIVWILKSSKIVSRWIRC